jgi:hypothetical protein
MKDKKKIKELEAKIEELERRLFLLECKQPQEWYPVPYYPVYPIWKYDPPIITSGWCEAGTSTAANVSCQWSTTTSVDWAALSAELEPEFQAWDSLSDEDFINFEQSLDSGTVCVD